MMYVFTFNDNENSPIQGLFPEFDFMLYASSGDHIPSSYFPDITDTTGFHKFHYFPKEIIFANIVAEIGGIDSFHQFVLHPSDDIDKVVMKLFPFIQ